MREWRIDCKREGNNRAAIQARAKRCLERQHHRGQAVRAALWIRATCQGLSRRSAHPRSQRASCWLCNSLPRLSAAAGLPRSGPQHGLLLLVALVRGPSASARLLWSPRRRMGRQPSGRGSHKSAQVRSAAVQRPATCRRLTRLPARLAVLGSQWGDEGKGKLVDILAQQYDIVARCQVRPRFMGCTDMRALPARLLLRGRRCGGCAGIRVCGACRGRAPRLRDSTFNGLTCQREISVARLVGIARPGCMLRCRCRVSRRARF